MKKRTLILSILLAAMMLFCLIPATSFGEAAVSYQLCGKYEEEGAGAKRVSAAFKLELYEDGAAAVDRYRYMEEDASDAVSNPSYDKNFMTGAWHTAEKNGENGLEIQLACRDDSGAEFNAQTLFVPEADGQYTLDLEFPIMVGMEYKRTVTLSGDETLIYTDDNAFIGAFKLTAAEDPAVSQEEMIGAGEEATAWQETDWAAKTLLCQMTGKTALYGTIELSVFMDVFDDNTIRMISGLFIPAGTSAMGKTQETDAFTGGDYYYGTYHKAENGTLVISLVSYDLPKPYAEELIAEPITGGYTVTLPAYYEENLLTVTISGGQRQVDIGNIDEIITHFGGGSGTYVAVPAISAESYTRQEITVEKKDGRILYGEYLLPAAFDAAGGEKISVVLLIHGNNSYHEVPLLNCGTAFASAGYATVCFDFCGTNPANSKSDSSEASVEAYNEYEGGSCEDDLEDILAWIREQPFADMNAFFVYGESRGGKLAAEFTERYKDLVKGAVLMYPGKTEADLSAFGKKILVFQGTADTIGDPERTRALAEKHQNIVLTEIEGGGHGGWTAQQYRDVQNMILDYYAECRGINPGERAQIVVETVDETPGENTDSANMESTAETLQTEEPAEQAVATTSSGELVIFSCAAEAERAGVGEMTITFTLAADGSFTGTAETKWGAAPFTAGTWTKDGNAYVLTDTVGTFTSVPDENGVQTISGSWPHDGLGVIKPEAKLQSSESAEEMVLRGVTTAQGGAITVEVTITLNGDGTFTGDVLTKWGGTVFTNGTWTKEGTIYTLTEKNGTIWTTDLIGDNKQSFTGSWNYGNMGPFTATVVEGTVSIFGGETEETEPESEQPKEYADAVSTASGEVIGFYNTDHSVISYLGIPYAKAPVGDLRWSAPEKPEPWTEALICDSFKANPVTYYAGQRSATEAEFGVDMKLPFSEDSLFVNVWTGTDSTEKKPVVFFVYGGGFTTGGSSCPLYNGEELAQQGVIFVTCNYRLGGIGMLSHIELTETSGYNGSGNYNMMDVIAALRWVQTNITAFGGDPGNITLMGQSAGSAMVHALVASPEAQGLFQRAFTASADIVLNSRSEGVFESDLKTLSVFGNKTLAELREMDADEIMKTYGTNVRLVEDGKYLTKPILQAYADGTAEKIPMIMGLVTGDIDEVTVADEAAYETEIRSRFGNFAEKVLAKYPATDADAQQVMDRVLEDAALMRLQYQAKQYTTGGRTAYVYLMAHSYPEAKTPAKCQHSHDLPYWFDHFSKAREQYLTDTDRALGEELSGYLVSFATTDVPDTGWTPSTGEGSYLLIDDTAHMETVDPAVITLWMDYYDSVADR